MMCDMKSALPRLSAFLTVALLCSCAAGANGTDTSSAASGTIDADALTASCGAATLDHLPPDTPSLAPFHSFDGLDMSNVGGEAPYFRKLVESYDWFTTQAGDDWRDLFGAPTATDLDPPYAYIRLELRGEKWAPVGWGQCSIELDAKGWSNAHFRIDPKTPPDPTADKILVRATENACAGGQRPPGRQVQGVVLDENERSISIVILVEPTSGATTCQGNPSFPFEVDLGTALGDRKILDASVYPANQQWPPT
jgi:hypothetical protein